MRKFIVFCCVLTGLLAGSIIAFGQNESAPKPTEMATPSVTVAATITPSDTALNVGIRALDAILFAVSALVIIPIVVFALYNKFALKAVLDANKETKGEPVTKLIKAIIPPEPLGMPNGSVRAIIAIVGISIFAYAIFAFPDYRKDLLTALISLLSAVIGFYFGARATEPVRKPKKTDDEDNTE